MSDDLEGAARRTVAMAGSHVWDEDLPFTKVLDKYVSELMTSARQDNLCANATVKQLSHSLTQLLDGRVVLSLWLLLEVW